MGSPASEPNRSTNEGPEHTVTIAPFYMGKYEVTFAEYDAFATATGRTLPNDYGYGRGTRPVISVSWDDAVAYTAWLSVQTGSTYRLPSESEWEYANRAGTTTAYWWGASVGSNNANCAQTSSPCGDSFANTSPVGSFAANRFGLHDTLGNVWEWTADDYHSNYTGAPTDGTPWITAGSGYRVLRGGSWTDASRSVRSATRSLGSPPARRNYLGFRVSRAN